MSDLPGLIVLALLGFIAALLWRILRLLEREARGERRKAEG